MCIHWSRDASCIHNESATKDENEHANIAVWYIKTCDDVVVVVDRRTSESGNYYVERRKIRSIRVYRQSFKSDPFGERARGRGKARERGEFFGTFSPVTHKHTWNGDVLRERNKLFAVRRSFSFSATAAATEAKVKNDKRKMWFAQGTENANSLLAHACTQLALNRRLECMQHAYAY